MAEHQQQQQLPSQHKPVIIIGAGLAGLVAAYELTRKDIPVTIIEQENENNLGGQAYWSLGGIFCIDSATQRRYGVRDSHALALADWMNTAKFDRLGPKQNSTSPNERKSDQQPKTGGDSHSNSSMNDPVQTPDPQASSATSKASGVPIDDDNADHAQDFWAHQWAEAFVDFATNKMERYLQDRGVKFLSVGWAERGAGRADGHGNSVPRFHLTWGTGPEIVRAFAEPVVRASKTPISSSTGSSPSSWWWSKKNKAQPQEEQEQEQQQQQQQQQEQQQETQQQEDSDSHHQQIEHLVTFRYRHRVDSLILDLSTGAAIGVSGQILTPTSLARGVASPRTTVGPFSIHGRAVIIATGGIGGNLPLVRRNWPVSRLGPTIPDPSSFVIGVPAHVDGRMLEIASAAGARLTNMDRMWHYTEGLVNWDPIWPNHGIRVIPGPSSLWLDATGNRLPPPLYPGCDTLATLKHICATGYGYSWFILNRKIVAREFALSGSEQNPDVTGKSYLQFFRQRYWSDKGTDAVQAFLEHGKDFVVENDLRALVEGMNRLNERKRKQQQDQKEDGTGSPRDVPVLDYTKILTAIQTRDMQLDNNYTKDSQIMLIANARKHWPEKLRVAPPHKILDPTAGSLIAVRMNLLTRKSLGGLQTNLDGNVMTNSNPKGESSSSSSSHLRPFPSLYAAGEAAGFGGGGMHGYASLEGTFLGGCIFSGYVAGRAVAKAVSGVVAESRL
ncbi:KsdD-like steroid dehydrogenase [Exophiala dermatitidis]